MCVNFLFLKKKLTFISARERLSSCSILYFITFTAGAPAETARAPSDTRHGCPCGEIRGLRWACCVQCVRWL